MSVYHILNGDSLYHGFPQDSLNGEVIVFREALIEGPIDVKCDATYFEARATYFEKTYGHSKLAYRNDVVPEYKKIQAINEHDQVYLWFEDDLFCQVNLWFVVHMLANKNVDLFIVSPISQENTNHWLGFGNHDSGKLISAFENASTISSLQLSIIKDCLALYISNDVAKIMHYVRSTRSIYKIYPLYANVLKAHLKRFSLSGQLSPLELSIKEIVKGGVKDFESVFKTFNNRFGIYGFGDVQFRHLYDRVIKSDQ